MCTQACPSKRVRVLFSIICLFAVQMVRLALRAGLVARRKQLVAFNIQLPPLPPAGSPEEEAELLQGLFTITPDWQQQVDK
jgi:hypothetical protein